MAIKKSAKLPSAGLPSSTKLPTAILAHRQITAALEELPPGLEKAVLSILARCAGQKLAVGRGRLVELARLAPGLGQASDRQVRKAIENLREQGVLICNLLDGEGYFMANTLEEYQAFRAQYGSYAFTMLEKIKAMDRAADERWGEERTLQRRMF